MKTKLQIKYYFGEVLFEYEIENNTIKKTIEKANLRGANLWGANGLKFYWHIHHEELVENLIEPIKNRIDYIKEYKPKEEITLRLKLLKKVKVKLIDLPVTKKGWIELHKKECGCKFKNSIFDNN